MLTNTQRLGATDNNRHRFAERAVPALKKAGRLARLDTI
jgi:hypothetical protein